MSDAVRKNALPTLASLTLHLGLLGALYYWETHRDPPPKVVEVQVIEAKLVALKTKTKVAHQEDTRKINKVEVSQAVEKEQDIKIAKKKIARRQQKSYLKKRKKAQRKEQEAKVEEELALKRKKEGKGKGKEAKEKAEAEAKPLRISVKLKNWLPKPRKKSANL